MFESRVRRRAIAAIFALTIPAAALVVAAPAANAAGCNHYGFADGVAKVNQSNGYRLEFPANGRGFVSYVTAFNNHQAVAGRGKVVGSVMYHEVSLTVTWDNGVIGEYSGNVDDNGMARGDTWGGGGNATWNSQYPLVCVG